MITFRVPDMTCGGCAGRIAKAVAAADPDARVTVDIPQHLVGIEAAAANAGQLHAAIEAAGYSPALVTAQPASAPRASGGCCCR